MNALTPRMRQRERERECVCERENVCEREMRLSRKPDCLFIVYIYDYRHKNTFAKNLKQVQMFTFNMETTKMYSSKLAKLIIILKTIFSCYNIAS